MNTFFYLTATGLRVWREVSGEPLVHFSVTDLERFKRWLAETAHDGVCVFYLIVDLADEAYQSASYPALNRADRQRWLQRKLVQFSGENHFALALTPRQPNLEMTLVALTRPQFIMEWLTAIQANASWLLAGVYSASQLLAQVPRMATATDPTISGAANLVVSISAAGWRFVFLQGGQLRYARLLELPSAACDLSPNSENLMDEIMQVRSYFVSQQWLEREAALPVTLLANETAWAALTWGERHHSSSLLQFSHLPLADGESVEVRLLSHLRNTPPKDQFAPATLLRPWQCMSARRSLRRVSVISVLTTMILAGAFWGYALKTRSEITPLAALTAHLDNQHRQVLATAPQLTITAAELEAVAREAKQLNHINVGPATLLQALASVLDQYPQMELQQLEWRLVPSHSGAPVKMELDAQFLAITQQKEQAQAVANIVRALRQEGIGVDVVRDAPVADSHAVVSKTTAAAPGALLRLYREITAYE